MTVESLLREMRETGSLTQLLIASKRLSDAARHEPASVNELTAAMAGEDQAVAIAALHAVSHIGHARSGASGADSAAGAADADSAADAHSAADAILAAALRDPRPFMRTHAAWGSARRRPYAPSINPLVALLITGGMDGMLAQRALEAWRIDAADAIIDHLAVALRSHSEPPVRRRLTETLGLMSGPRALAALENIASDASEAEEVREAASDALGDALDDAHRSDARRSNAASRAGTPVIAGAAEALTVAQLFLGADIDSGLRTVGSGNNGGIATLLVRLGDALLADSDAGADAHSEGPAVGRVLTISRCGDAAADADTKLAPEGHAYSQIRLPVAVTRAEDTWSNFIAARRGIARALAAQGIVHAIHLRMADVGTLAAWDIARAAGIPVIFTAAPDPHALIESLELAGTLTRENFGDHDAQDRYWFRAQLVREIAGAAAHTVLMPRERLRADLQRLVGVEIDDPAQYTAVAEGIDVTVVDAAVAEARSTASGSATGPALQELTTLLEELPPHRRGLPLLVTVGRLHRVKGMSTIVEAWADPALRERCNLLIVGGNLALPSADESEQIAQIDALVDPSERPELGLLMTGHRPNQIAARWIAAARFGIPGLAAPNGVYVCGSMKEEFGLAILEAMAAGLFVVAPLRGGPATYVESGRTGILADTSDPGHLRAAIVEGLALAAERPDDRAAATRKLVSERFSIHTMARTLAGIYAAAHQRRTAAGLPRDWDLHA